DSDVPDACCPADVCRPGPGAARCGPGEAHMTGFTAQDRQQRRNVLLVLMLNAGLSLALGLGGLLADSSALLANAADNASDSAVYLLSFLAVGRAAQWKVRAARTSGVLLLVFAAAVLIDVGRRFLFG